jgi:hypothetical protein
MIHWVETPSTPPFICQGGGVGFTWKGRDCYSLTQQGLNLHLTNLQDLSIDYLLNRLGTGPPGSDLQVEWANS